MDADQIISFKGEVMLLQWAESSTRGRTVTFLLDNDSESHPFRDFTIKSGKRAGQRFMCVLVQIGDDERPVEQQQRYSQLAYLFCKDPTFWHWASERSFDRVDSEESAKGWMLSLLGFSSRSDIDLNDEHRTRFDLLIKIPFNSYRHELQEPV
jgi:hypothetical protein